MSEDNNQQNGTANGDVPEIELIIKVRVYSNFILSKNANSKNCNEFYDFHRIVRPVVANQSIDSVICLSVCMWHFTTIALTIFVLRPWLL